MARRRKMTDDELLGVIDRQIDSSNWTNDTTLREFQRSSLAAYYGGRPEKKTDGLSDAVSSDFADFVESTTAEILPSFDFETIALFTPTAPQDVEPARIESRIANGILGARAGYTTLQEAIRNAVMLRNGILKIWADRRIDVQTRRYVDLGALELESVTTPNAPNQEITLGPVTQGSLDNTVSLSVTRTTRFKRLDIVSVDPIEFFNTENWHDVDLADVPMCGEHYYLTESDLRGMGVTTAQLKKMTPSDGANTLNLAWNARNRTDQRTTPIAQDFGDPSMRLYETFELYTLVDYDGDGFAERRKIVKSGGVIWFNEPFPYVPYATGVVFLQPQRWMGLSLWDKLAELQVQKTEVLRQYLDNMAYANNSEVLAVDGAIELEDLKTRRPGGINRVDDINAVKPLVVPDMGQSSLALLTYLDKVRAERGGASLDLASAEGTVAAETAHGAERNHTALESLTRLMTKTFSETLVRQLFLLIHATLRHDFPEGGMAQMGGREFVEYTPGDWPARLDVTILAGMGVHERTERRNALEAVLIQQEKLQQSGLGNGILADLTTYHAALADWTAAGGVPNGQRYWVDPRSEPSIKAQQQSAQQAQEAAAKQENLQLTFAGSEAQAEQGRTIGEFINDQAKLRFDYWKANLDSAVEELKLENGEAQAQVDELQETGEVRSGAADVETA